MKVISQNTVKLANIIPKMINGAAIANIATSIIMPTNILMIASIKAISKLITQFLENRLKALLIASINLFSLITTQEIAYFAISDKPITTGTKIKNSTTYTAKGIHDNEAVRITGRVIKKKIKAIKNLVNRLIPRTGQNEHDLL